MAEAGLGALWGPGDTGMDGIARYDLEVALLYRLAELWEDLRYTSTALRYIEEAIARREHVHDLHPETRSETPWDVPTSQLLRSRGAIRVILGQWDAAEGDFDESLASIKRVHRVSGRDLQHVEAVVENSLCWFRIRQGNLADAEARCKRSLRLKQDYGAGIHQRSIAYSLGHLAEIHLRQIQLGTQPETASADDALRNVEMAVRFFAEARDSAGANPDWRNATEARFTYAVLLARKLDFDRAVGEAERALAYGEEEGSNFYRARAHRVLGEVYGAVGDFARAKHHLDESLHLMSLVEDDYEIACTAQVLGALLSATDGQESEARGMAQRHLSSAHQVFARLGATWELTKTERLLGTLRSR